MRLPVHCCCHPEKRLGFVEVPAGLARPGPVAFACGPWDGVQLDVIRTEIGTLQSQAHVAGRKYMSGGYLAVKSAHRPLDTWRHVQGFVPDMGSEDR